MAGGEPIPLCRRALRPSQKGPGGGRRRRGRSSASAGSAPLRAAARPRAALAPPLASRPPPHVQCVFDTSLWARAAGLHGAEGAPGARSGPRVRPCAAGGERPGLPWRWLLPPPPLPFRRGGICSWSPERLSSGTEKRGREKNASGRRYWNVARGWGPARDAARRAPLAGAGWRSTAQAFCAGDANAVVEARSPRPRRARACAVSARCARAPVAGSGLTLSATQRPGPRSCWPGGRPPHALAAECTMQARGGPPSARAPAACPR